MSPQIPSEMQAIHLTKFTSNISTLSPSTIPLTHDKETQLLIKVTHASPTHVDILYAQGLHQNNRTISKPPLTLGTDFAGILVCVPTEEPTNLKVGDRVYGSFFGAFAEYIAVHARLGSVRRVPKGWSLGEACAVGSAGAISLGCFLRGPPFKKGEWVLVTGASGGLGVAACQVAKALGARVIGLVGDEEKAGILRGIGVDACVDYKKVKWEQEVLRISDGGVALVYDGVGMVESGLRCCRFGGSVVIVGFAGRGGEMENLKVNRILLKGAGVLGYVSSWRTHLPC